MIDLALLTGSTLLGSATSAVLGCMIGQRRLQPLRDRLTEGQEALASLRAGLGRERRRRRLIENAVGDVVVQLDTSGRVRFASGAVVPMLGLEPVDLLGDGLAERLNPGEPALLTSALAVVGADNPALSAAWRIRRHDDRLIWVDIRLRHQPDDRGFVLTLHDISQRKETEEHLAEAQMRLRRLAMHDSLTGLPNRAWFVEAANQVLDLESGLALLFIDLDRFRPVNDVHGHAIGDTVLREVGRRLGQWQMTQPIVGRFGADEFVAILRMPDGETGVTAIARDMLRAVSDPIRVGALSLEISASIGIAISGRDGVDAASLLQAADIALAQAKQAGGARYRFFEAYMRDVVEQREILKAELPAAIAEGQIIPYFQPLVRMDDTVIIGFEVLARWQHPDRGILSPVEFLPLVEATGQSTAMFTSMLTRACLAARLWPGHIRLSLNISAAELQDEGLPDAICGILRHTGFDGKRLEIEITENALIHDARQARRVLDRLRELGASVALDDFGTGYSSLYHLRELPFDKVKIDKSFMHALDTDAESARYVAAIVGLCHALGLEMTAEGIEDTVTLQHLRALGCTYGQGYLFGRPVPAEDAGRLLLPGIATAAAGSVAMVAA